MAAAKSERQNNANGKKRRSARARAREERRKNEQKYNLCKTIIIIFNTMYNN